MFVYDLLKFTANTRGIFGADFKNALDVVNILKPDLIISNEFPNLIDLALYAVSKNSNSIFLKSNIYLPSSLVSIKKISSTAKINSFTPFLSSFISLFYATNDYQYGKKYFLIFSRLNFLGLKFKFFIKTLIFSKLKFMTKYDLFLCGINYLINQKYPYINSKLSADLEFCNSSPLYDLMCNQNYP